MRYKKKSFLHPNERKFYWYITDNDSFHSKSLKVEPRGPYMSIPEYLYDSETVAADVAHRMNTAYEEK